MASVCEREEKERVDKNQTNIDILAAVFSKKFLGLHYVPLRTVFDT